MKQLLILSGKGGTGKTTVAGAFIKLAKAKAYADCDVDAPNLHLIMGQNTSAEKTDHFGLSKAVIDRNLCIKCGLCIEHCRFDAIKALSDYTVDTFACEGCGVCEAVCQSGAVTMKPSVSGELLLYRDGAVFSSAQLKTGSGASGKLVAEVKRQLREAAADADFAVIDGSPGIGCPVISSLSGVNTVLIVTESSESGISDMKRILKTARIFGVKTAVCINKYDINEINTEKTEEFCKKEDVFLAGEIPFDREAVKAVNSGKSIVDIDCAAGRAVKEVFENTMRFFHGVIKCR